MTLRIQVPKKYRPLLAPCRYKGAYGGRGSGKSHFFAEQITIQGYASPKRIVCLREVQNTIKDSVKQLLTDKINKLGLSQFYTVLDNEIRAANGSMIVFKGMQSFNADNIKSLEGFDIAWVEEAQTLSQHSLDLLRPTIRKPGSELWFSWNPRYKTDAVDKFFRKDIRDNAISVQINWNDNPWFKDTPLYQDMLDDFAADADKAEHVWNGAYGSSVGAILARWVNEAEREGRINNDVAVDKYGAGLVVSCDLGFRDTASFWYWQPVIGGFNLVDYQQGHGLDADDWIPEIKKTLNKLGGKLDRIWLPHDARSKTFQSKHTTQEKFQAGFGIDKIRIVPQSRKADQIEAARHVIKTCAFHADNCEQGLDGLRAWEYVYNEDAGVFSREPNHNWASHPADAFAYGCQVMMMDKPKDEPEKELEFWDSKTLDDLWKESTHKKGKRI